MIYVSVFFSSTVAQYIYALLATVNALILFDAFLVAWLARKPRYIKIKPDTLFSTLSRVPVLASFYMSVYITGAHPQFQATQIAPFIRLSWLCVLLFLMVSVTRTTLEIYRAMWQNAHGGDECCKMMRGKPVKFVVKVHE